MFDITIHYDYENITDVEENEENAQQCTVKPHEDCAEENIRLQ